MWYTYKNRAERNVDMEYRIIRIPETASTNTYIKALASDMEKICVIADRQTGGRGRLGRSFESPEGGLYMSFLCPPMTGASDAVTARVAVAAARAIEDLTGLELRIKWVNDLYCGGRKLAGILTENVWSGGEQKCLVIGIGVNLTDGGLTEALHGIATSVEAEGGRIPSRETLAAEIISEFERCVDFREEYRERQLLIGCPVEVHRGSEIFSAFAEDIDESCAVVLRLDSGERTSLTSGEISIRAGEYLR